MKIVLYNIGYGTGLKGSLKDYFLKFWRYVWAPQHTIKKIARLLKCQKADVVCLLETDIGSIRARWKSQVKDMALKLSSKFTHHHSKYPPTSWYASLPFFRHQHDAILSQVAGKVIPHYLTSGLKNLVQEFVVGNVSIFVVHLGLLRSKLRKNQLHELTQILKKCPRKYLVCGDFNIFDGLEEIADFLKENTLKLVQKTATFPAFRPKRMLDLILACKDLPIKACGVLKSPHSDHLPVWVEI